jgi:hypothetical protein
MSDGDESNPLETHLHNPFWKGRRWNVQIVVLIPLFRIPNVFLLRLALRFGVRCLVASLAQWDPISKYVFFELGTVDSSFALDTGGGGKRAVALEDSSNANLGFECVYILLMQDIGGGNRGEWN